MSIKNHDSMGVFLWFPQKLVVHIFPKTVSLINWSFIRVYPLYTRQRRCHHRSWGGVVVHHAPPPPFSNFSVFTLLTPPPFNLLTPPPHLQIHGAVLAYRQMEGPRCWERRIVSMRHRRDKVSMAWGMMPHDAPRSSLERFEGGQGGGEYTVFYALFMITNRSLLGIFSLIKST